MDSVSAILTNKTFWANLLTPIFTWAATKYGLQLDTQTQTMVIVLVVAVMNVVVEHWTGPGLGTKTEATNFGKTP